MPHHEPDPPRPQGATPTVPALPSERLYRAADLSGLDCATTAELEPLEERLGQNRAERAIRFGTGIRQAGFNLFVIGPAEARMKEAVKALLKDAAPETAPPSDYVYVNNFRESHKPIAIALPPCRAPEFRDAMHELIDDLKSALPAVFESEDYRTRRGAIDEAFHKKQEAAFTLLREKAGGKGIVILRTPMGVALAPARNGAVIPPDEFSAWPKEQQDKIQNAIQDIEKDLEHIMDQIPRWEKERRDEIRKLNRDTAQLAIGHSIEEAKARFTDLPRIISHLEAVRSDLVENVAMFIVKSEDGEREALEAMPSGPFDRYEVNVLVTQSGNGGRAPVVEELHPTLSNLTGRIEYVSRQGALLTNFRLIKAGAIHRANGGYLLVDARSLLMEPFAWTALKRALRRGEIAIEDIARFAGLTSTVSLEPDPIPLDIKIILFGERLLYYLLAAFDAELPEFFKVLADFEDDVDRSAESEVLAARLIAAIVRKEGLRPIERDGIGRLIEHAARLADHAGKLTLHVEQMRNVLAEADYWAGKAGRATTTRADVEQALDESIRRSSRLRDRAQETILRDIALIDTTGSRVGQINGLSVSELGGFRFGRPTRITCLVRPGAGKLVDIEREVELGGPIHSKGVLILSGFLAGRYALDTPMSLFASLVFEQSYSGVEGDSASSAELYALLSSLAELPLRQDLAVTGSVNQHGQVQAIGGVNEKIEGFFDICRARGLTGSQGVVIPQANVQHLMLRRDAVEACAAGRFSIYPVSTVDEGIVLLTGRPAGERGADGQYAEGSVNRLVEDRLRSFAHIRRSFDRGDRSEPGER